MPTVIAILMAILITLIRNYNRLGLLIFVSTAAAITTITATLTIMLRCGRKVKATKSKVNLNRSSLR